MSKARLNRKISFALCRERLRREIQAKHSAIHLVHVHHSASHFHLIVADGSHARHRNPANPFFLGFKTHGAGLNEGADPGIRREFETDADLLVGPDVAL